LINKRLFNLLKLQNNLLKIIQTIFTRADKGNNSCTE